MLRAVRNFFALPFFADDPQRTDAAVTTHRISVALLVIGVLGGAVSLLPGTGGDITGRIASFIGALIWLGCIALNKRGQTLIANSIIIGMNTLIINAIVYLAGGLPNLTAIANILVLALAALLLPARGIIGTAIATIALLGFMYLRAPQAEATYTAQSLMIIYGFTALATGLILEIAAGNLRAVVQRVRASEKELFEKNEALQAFSEGLETMVNDRTAALQTSSMQLERRAQQFSAIAEISRSVVALQDLESLLNTIVHLISTQFNFYHVGIFLLDENKDYAVLRATNSEGGRRMLARGHRLRVGAQGIVGYVTQRGRPRIALDTGLDATFFSNPDLPTTHSEAALPLIIGGEVIGALDVQSELQAAFNESDISVLGILADQVSVAIQNARLYEQTTRALNELRQSTSENIRADWRRFASRSERVGYQLAGASVEPLRKNVEAGPLKDAIRAGEVKTSAEAMAIPIKLRGETIGVIGLKARRPGREWSETEIATAQAAAERVALAAENARLVEESQRRAAIERLTSDISGKISASLRFETILRTAAEEISRALNSSDVVVQIQPGTSKPGPDKNS